MKYKNDYDEKENMTVKNILRNSFSKITQQKNRDNAKISSPNNRGRSFTLNSPKASCSFTLNSPKASLNHLNLTSQTNLISKLHDSKSKSKFETKN